jgi:hypothetical protein
MGSPLRESMRLALRARNLSPRTERTYLSLVARFAQFHQCSPAARPEILYPHSDAEWRATVGCTRSWGMDGAG